MLGWNEAAWFSILAGAAVKSLIALAAAWLAAVLLRGGSAGVRHLAWTVGFAAVLILPFLSAGLPAWRIPLGAQPANVLFRGGATAPAEVAARRQSAPSFPARAARPAGWHPDWRMTL